MTEFGSHRPHQADLPCGIGHTVSRLQRRQYDLPRCVDIRVDDVCSLIEYGFTFPRRSSSSSHPPLTRNPAERLTSAPNIFYLSLMRVYVQTSRMESVSSSDQASFSNSVEPVELGVDPRQAGHTTLHIHDRRGHELALVGVPIVRLRVPCLREVAGKEGAVSRVVAEFVAASEVLTQSVLLLPNVCDECCRHHLVRPCHPSFDSGKAHCLAAVGGCVALMGLGRFLAGFSAGLLAGNSTSCQSTAPCPP